MVGKDETKSAPMLAIWLGRGIMFLGALLLKLSIAKTFIEFWKEDGGFLNSLNTVYEGIGAATGFFTFGAAVSFGNRWHLFALLIFVFFGSLVVGLFSMVG